MGIEPTTSALPERCSNRLSYPGARPSRLALTLVRECGTRSFSSPRVRFLQPVYTLAGGHTNYQKLILIYGWGGICTPEGIRHVVYSHARLATPEPTHASIRPRLTNSTTLSVVEGYYARPKSAFSKSRSDLEALLRCVIPLSPTSLIARLETSCYEI